MEDSTISELPSGTESYPYIKGRNIEDWLLSITFAIFNNVLWKDRLLPLKLLCSLCS